MALTDNQCSHQIRVHQLEASQHLESTVFRLDKGWTVQFKVGPSLLGKNIILHTNHPPPLWPKFDRNSYHKLSWCNEGTNKADHTSLYTDLVLTMAGSFHYYFVIKGSSKVEGEGYFVVDPVLSVGPKDELLPLDCIQCQTYLTKSLGTFDQWESRLAMAKETGYNMIHFSPIQELGLSQSSYSLKDQLSLNSRFNTDSMTYTLEDVQVLVEKMKNQWKVLSLTDIVLNHTANESPWLQEHPECAYNLTNSPHLRPAYLLDRVLFYCALDLVNGKWPHMPHNITHENHLSTLESILHQHYIEPLRLEEFYMVKPDLLVGEFSKSLVDPSLCSSSCVDNKETELKIIQDPHYRRLSCSVNLAQARKLYSSQGGSADKLDECCRLFHSRLLELNEAKREEIRQHLRAAVRNVLANIRYERLQGDGPKLGVLTRKNPLVPRYFYRPGPDLSIEDEEKLILSPECSHIMAHNGWVMDYNPLLNFAQKDSNVYLRRELIAWADSVKLYYGEGPQDCPYLWKHMTRYVQQMATIFHGLRLDNCHSTPIHVAQYLLDKAREVRPDLYVIAELFTSSEKLDNIFVNKLGINSLIREGMSANNSHELGRLIHRFGGEPVGAFFQPSTKPLTPSMAHAIFLDITHDNPSPINARSVYDLLPSAALIAMACCATGSTRGYDELVPHHIHVVDEERPYGTWDKEVTDKTGIVLGKRALNILHKELGASGFSQVYVDQVDENIVAVTRHCPATHQSVILIARTSFHHPQNIKETGYIPPLCVPGVVEEVILEGRIRQKTNCADPSWKRSEDYINGLSYYYLDIREHIKLSESEMVESNNEKFGNEVEFTSFPPGSIVAFRVSLSTESRTAILKLRTCLAQFGYRMRSYSGKSLQPPSPDFESIVRKLNFEDLNRVLFRCDEEEREEGSGTYHIPNFGNLTYCGLQGLITLLSTIHMQQDLGHLLCEHIRQGDWLMDYITNRLLNHNGTKEIGAWFNNTFNYLKLIPRYLIPCYFDILISGAYSVLLKAVWKKMSKFVLEGSTFVKALALGSVALMGVVKSSPLPAVFYITDGSSNTPTVAAGLPHFSTGYTRNWGRDTFIALRGLCLITGRHEEARRIILAYAGCLRHGLIPNLLDGGHHARYNCRDATWWWLQAIQDYCILVPQGEAILKELVYRLYPNDEYTALPIGRYTQPLYEIIHEALTRHFQGIKFREYNAGSTIDSQMTDQGFNLEIGVDSKTGFVYGGNIHNCGTWMDKMGSSEKAGNKGKPATPRDGSAVELVGLCKSAVRWLCQMHKEGLYPYGSVTKTSLDGQTKELSLEDWNILIQANFEKYFWVPDDGSVSEVERAPSMINRRGIYKDCVHSTRTWEDYQLRPNFAITMVVAPELFNVDHAWKALTIQQEHLLGPLGMKTLDPSDWSYRGDYVNNDDSTDPTVAHGFNYHQGPEWLWPVGFFLRAKLYFAKKKEEETVLFTTSVLSKHFYHIQQSVWKGLPELTNSNGKDCPDGCPIQAWSHATLLEVLYDFTSNQQNNA